MRPSVFLAAIPFFVGCAQPVMVRTPSLPSDEPLQVRLHQPSGGALNYELTEPAYVAIFAIHRGEGISMIYPHFRGQIDDRSKAGFNQQHIHRLNTSWAYSVSAGSRRLLGHPDAYYAIASKYPLPVEGILKSPWALRSLVGADLFRAANLNDTWSALEEMLVEGLPDDAWASDEYLTWRDPFTTLSSYTPGFIQYCSDGRGFLAFSLLDTGPCNLNGRTASVTPPIAVVEVPPRRPPKKPFDVDPKAPLPPDAVIARTFNSRNEVIRRERSRRNAESSRSGTARPSERSRGESARPSDRSRGETARTTEREVNPTRRETPARAPAPSRPTESRPQQQPSRPEGKRPEPKPDNN